MVPAVGGVGGVGDVKPTSLAISDQTVACYESLNLPSDFFNFSYKLSPRIVPVS